MILYLAILTSFLALFLAGYQAKKIYSLDVGNEKMKEIADAIHKGAMVFLHREYRTLAVFSLVVAGVLYLTLSWQTALCFLAGAFFSALAGNIGMRVATAANVRTAQAVRKDMAAGLKTAFSSGLIMGLAVVGLGVLGVSILYGLFNDPNILFGFGFGASSIALFARVGGGIFTKGADVGADLVGKIEAGIPEDDYRNPAVIADLVGDNVGDTAGMGADLFESYVDSIIATMALGVAFSASGGHVLLPLAIAATGILASMVGSFFVSGRGDLHSALNRGIFTSAILAAVASYFVVNLVLGPGNVGVYLAVVAGLVSGVIIGLISEYYTSAKYGPTKNIAHSAERGAAVNLLTGLSVGMYSTVIPLLSVCAAIFVSYHFAGIYGVSLAAVGMLATLGITLAVDCYGPVADNAAGIAEMAGLGKDVRERAEALDAVGNTTAAMGKGFAIGSAALTALALYVAYAQVAGLKYIDVLQPRVTIGLLLGSLMPFLFSSYAISAVGRLAEQIVVEVRRQFKEIKGLMEGTAKADYEKCIEISTDTAIKYMRTPTLIAITSPIIVGFTLGSETLGGFLAGTVASGFLLAVMMANSGAAWDNAKKYIEEGNYGGKGSPTHKAAVVGDTVGDAFKDTAGPSLNILIKLISIVALVFAPLFNTTGLL